MIPSAYENRLTVGDARELCKRIPDNSVDLIFTDPPYPKEYLYLYEWLAEEAARVLRPGGWCLSMCGTTYFNQILPYFERAGLTYFWIYNVFQSQGVVFPRGLQMPIVTRTKIILAYSKGDAVPRSQVIDLYMGTSADKRYHLWGQDATSARYYIDCHSHVGDVVLDPFCGGGTTPYVCEQLGRHWVGFEIDPEAAAVTNSRLLDVQMPLVLHTEEQHSMNLGATA